MRRLVLAAIVLALLAPGAMADEKIMLRRDPLHPTWLDPIGQLTGQQMFYSPKGGGFGVSIESATGIPALNGSGSTTFIPPGVGMMLFDPASDVVIGDAQVSFHLPYNFTLVSVHAGVDSPSTGGPVTVNLRNGAGEDILSTALTIDAGETGSHTAAVPAVINPARAGLAAWEYVRVDVDTANGAKGLIVFVGVKP